MDLVAWIAADLAGLRQRLTGSVLTTVPTERWHEVVDQGGSTITHLVLHLARHQDLAVATAIGGRQPLFITHRRALGLADAPSWSGLGEREDHTVSNAVSTDALGAYLDDVMTASTTWLNGADATMLDHVPDVRTRLVDLADLAVDDVPWLHRMWADQPVWWLVQWPVLGHGHAHTGEAISVRNRMGLSPF
jgi:hypothetical protein